MTALTAGQIDELRSFDTARDRIGYWSYLGRLGDTYAPLALDVVQNSSVSGAVANAYAVNISSAFGVNLSNTDLANIGLDLMDADFNVRSANGTNLAVSIIRDYHTQVFNDYGLPDYAWTAFTPTFNAGSSGEEAVWQEMLTSSFFTNAASQTQQAISDWLYGNGQSNQSITDWYNGVVQSTVAALTYKYASNVYGNYELVSKSMHVIAGDQGANPLSGTAGADIIMGFNSADDIEGGQGRDTIYGGNGDDILYGGSSSTKSGWNDQVQDVLLGGSGNDTYNITARSESTTYGLGDAINKYRNKSYYTDFISKTDIIDDSDNRGFINIQFSNDPSQAESSFHHVAISPSDASWFGAGYGSSTMTNGVQRWYSGAGMGAGPSAVQIYVPDTDGRLISYVIIEGEYPSYSPLVAIRNFQNGEFGITLPGYRDDGAGLDPATHAPPRSRSDAPNEPAKHYKYVLADKTVTIADSGNQSDLILTDVNYTGTILQRGVNPDNLDIHILATNETIHIDGQFNLFEYGELNSISFADGVTLTSSQIESILLNQSIALSPAALYGFAGSDETLRSGTGNQLLSGSRGLGGDADTYIYSKASGNDVIDDGGNRSKLIFDDIASNDVSLSRNGGSNDLTLYVNSTGKTVTVQNQFNGFGAGTLASIKFSDNVELSAADIRNTLLTKQISGSSANIYGYWGVDDTIQAGSGDRYIAGSVGIGGDHDTYIYSSLGGNDIIDDGGSNSQLVFSDIGSTTVSLTRDGPDQDLIISLAATGKTVTVRDQFSDYGGALSKISFADGVTWSVSDVVEHTQVLNAPTGNGTPNDDRIIGTEGADSINGGDGNDFIDGRGGNDTVLGGAGNDILRGGSGDDTLSGGVGKNQISGGPGRDTASYDDYRSTYDLGFGVDENSLIYNTVISNDTAHTTQDTLTSVEHIQFRDMDFDLGPSGPVFHFGTILHSMQTAGGTVYALYEGLLDHAPDALTLEAYSYNLTHGGAFNDVIQAVLSSSEGQAHYGSLSDAGYVQALYQNVLHRASDAGGQAYYEGLLQNGSSRASIAEQFVLSPEHGGALAGDFDQGLFVADQNAADSARLFYAVLGRAPDLAGLDQYRSSLENGASLQSVAASLLNSSEGVARSGQMTNAAFVDSLFEEALGRPADTGALTYYSGQLGAGSSRAEIATIIGESGEAHTFHLMDIERGFLIS